MTKSVGKRILRARAGDLVRRCRSGLSVDAMVCGVILCFASSAAAQSKSKGVYRIGNYK